MSSAEPLDRTPRMTLEHVVEFDRPIVELTVNMETPGDPLIVVIHASDSSTVVNATTGSHYGPR